MPPISPLTDEMKSDKLLKLNKEKLTAREHQERRHGDWNSNYELYRNKIRTNRLTQRQAVNIPLMKETIKTTQSKIDDPPVVSFQEKSGDELKEIIFQQMWDEMFQDVKLDWLDILDKKNVLLYGHSVKKLIPTKEGVEISILDPFDFVLDPLADPTNIDNARFKIHQNIFRSLRDVLADPRFSKEGKDKLKMWSLTSEGMIQSGKNKEEWDKKNDRLRAMGVSSTEFELWAGGDTLVNLSEHHTKLWNSKTQKFENRVIIYADDWAELLDEKRKNLIGIDQSPFVYWSEDPDSNDIYPDSIGDLVRTPNKILNIWFSQQVENRTLQNMQMHWYDSSVQGYTPQTYEPRPGGMLPAPGNPRETIFPVQVNGLDETFAAIDFLTRIVERASGTVAIEKGVSEQNNQTLGEIQILAGKAMERGVALQKFYRGSWREAADKWALLMQANPPRKMKLFKTGRSGKIFEKTVFASDWKSEAGYRVSVASSSEQEADSIRGIQKLDFVAKQSPNNAPLQRILRKRQLEILDLAPDELKEIMEAEEQTQEQVVTQQPQQTQTNQPQNPLLNQVENEILAPLAQ